MKKIINVLLKFTLSLIIIFSGSHSVFAETFVSGTISADTVWNRLGNPYVITGRVDVASGVTLKIEEGTEIRFEYTGKIYVKNEGNLEVFGTKDNPVVFTSNQESPQMGDYDGVTMFSGVKSTIKYAKFLYASQALVINSAEAIVENSIFTNNNLGIDISSGAVVNITKNIFSQNDTGIFYHNPFLFRNKSKINPFAFLLKIANADVSENRDVVISQNSFKNSSWSGIENGSYTATINAKNNYWNSPSGPTHSSNPTGTGDIVSNNVIFTPWLTSEPGDEPETPTCCSSVLFLPGFQASKLYRGSDNEEIWLPGPFDDTDTLLMNADGTSKRSDVYIGDIIKTAYLFADIYKSFSIEMDDMVTSGAISQWKPFAYDWRYGVDTIVNTPQKYATTTESLINTLRYLASNSYTNKVTIVAHSNGGLVAKYLVSILGTEAEQLIDRLVLVAVPQIGTPEAIGGLLHGFDQGLPLPFPPFSFFSPIESRIFGENLPGAYGLLPSSAYYSGDADIATSTIRFGEGDLLAPYRSLYGQGIQDSVTLRSFFLAVEGRGKPEMSDLDTPNILNSTLLSQAKNIHDMIDSQLIPENIKVEQIAGWGEKTLSGIDYYQGNKNTCNEDLSVCVLSPKILYKPSFVIDGDGTVVVPSALYMSTSSPNVRRWWVNLEDYNSENPRLEHKDIFEIPQIRQFISDLMSTSTPTNPDFIFANQPTSDLANRLEFYLHSPLDLSATDNNGNKISSTTLAIPNARYKRFGEVQYMSIPADTTFTLNLVGYASGSFDLDIEKTKGNNLLEDTYFSAIPTAIGTIASISFTDGTIENASPLSIDYENDGEIDVSLKPVIGEIVTIPPIILDSITPEAIIVFSTTTDSFKITGTDNITLNPIVQKERKSVIISDEAENTLTLSATIKDNNHQSEITISKLTYSTTTKFTSSTKSFAKYYRFKNLKTSKYVIFVSHIKTPDENIISIYEPLKNKTSIISILKTQNEIDLESVVKKLPKGAIIRKTINGLVIPYLETKMGKVIIKY